MTRTINLPQLELSMLREVLSFFKPSDKRQVYLVGGSIRDLLEGSDQLFDLDLATSFNPIPVAREYARKTGAGFVILDEERQIVRLVREIDENSHLTFDISAFRAASIDEDLLARDFTINAISARLTTDMPDGRLTIYDPLNGVEHLAKKLIIPCSDNLFTDDPLRIMRAFRFSALFNAEFSPKLHQMVVDQAHLLESVSGERIRDEFFKVLSVSDSVKWLRLMHTTGVLRIFVPELTDCVGVEQNEWHHLDVFEHTLLTLENLEQLLREGQNRPWWEAFIRYLDETVSCTRTYRQALKMGALLHDLGKPGCRKTDKETGKVMFHGHEMEGHRLTKEICERLRLSVNEMHYLQKVVKNHMRPGVMQQQGITDKRLFRFYSETGRDGLGIALLSLADRLSARGILEEKDIGEFSDGIFEIMNQFYEQFKRPHAPPFLNGNDLITNFSLKPGPKFREILEALEEAQFLGEVTTRDQALAFAQKMLQI